MDETTKKALNDFILEVIEGARTATNFAIEQTPLLVQEWIHWHISLAIFTFVVVLFAILTGALLMRAATKKSWGEGVPFAQGLGGVLIFFFLLVGSPGWGPVILYGVKAYVAPRVFLVETLIHLVR